jgi:hypothetical protein
MAECIHLYKILHDPNDHLSPAIALRIHVRIGPASYRLLYLFLLGRCPEQENSKKTATWHLPNKNKLFEN